MGVKYFDVYRCYSCRGKLEAKSDILGECTRCSTTQRLDHCKELANPKIDVEGGGSVFHLLLRKYVRGYQVGHLYSF